MGRTKHVVGVSVSQVPIDLLSEAVNRFEFDFANSNLFSLRELIGETKCTIAPQVGVKGKLPLRCGWVVPVFN